MPHDGSDAPRPAILASLVGVLDAPFARGPT